MSFYRSLVAVVAAMGLASAVFAADEMTTSTTTQTETTTTSTQTVEKVNVNTASAKDLLKVKGLNSARAKAIVAYRKKHGDFKTLDDLKMVNGFKKMNDANMKMVQDQLTVS